MQTITNLQQQPENMSMGAAEKSPEHQLGAVIAARSAKRQAAAEKAKSASPDIVEASRIVVPAFLISAAFAMALLWDDIVMITVGA